MYTYSVNTNEKDFFSSFLSYGVCLAKQGRSQGAEKVAKALLDKIRNVSKIESEIGVLEIADIYLVLENYRSAIEVFKESYSIYAKKLEWVQNYFYSLAQCKRSNDAECLLEQIIREENELITEILNDDEWEEDEIRERVQDIKQEIYEYRQSFLKIQNGYRPQVEYIPTIKGDCYLFGCNRHKHSDYQDHDILPLR